MNNNELVLKYIKEETSETKPESAIIVKIISDIFNQHFTKNIDNFINESKRINN